MKWQKATVLVLGFKKIITKNFKKFGYHGNIRHRETEFQLLCNILCWSKRKLNYKAIENKNIKKKQKKNGYK